MHFKSIELFIGLIGKFIKIGKISNHWKSIKSLLLILAVSLFDYFHKLRISLELHHLFTSFTSRICKSIIMLKSKLYT